LAPAVAAAIPPLASVPTIVPVGFLAARGVGAGDAGDVMGTRHFDEVPGAAAGASGSSMQPPAA